MTFRSSRAFSLAQVATGLASVGSALPALAAPPRLNPTSVSPTPQSTKSSSSCSRITLTGRTVHPVCELASRRPAHRPWRHGQHARGLRRLQAMLSDQSHRLAVPDSRRCHRPLVKVPVVGDSPLRGSQRARHRQHLVLFVAVGRAGERRRRWPRFVPSTRVGRNAPVPRSPCAFAIGARFQAIEHVRCIASLSSRLAFLLRFGCFAPEASTQFFPLRGLFDGFQRPKHAPTIQAKSGKRMKANQVPSSLLGFVHGRISPPDDLVHSSFMMPKQGHPDAGCTLVLDGAFFLALHRQPIRFR